MRHTRTFDIVMQAFVKSTLVLSQLGWLLLASSCIAVQARAASPEFQAAVADSAPVLYYQLNEASGTAINYGSLGAAYDATYLGTPLRAVPTASGDAGVRFDHQHDYLESANVAPPALSGNPTFTTEAVVFVLADGGAALWAPLLHWGISSPGDPTMKSVYFSFSNFDASEIYAGFYNGGLQTIDPVALGQWHHVVWVRDGGGPANSGSTVYVDGAAVGLEDDPDLPANAGTPDVVNTEFRIDRARNFTRWFTGNLDEVALYDRALDAGEVSTHFAALGTCDVPSCINFDGACRSCGLPVSSGVQPVASDALIILRRAVGSARCNLCVCDVDSSGDVVATDALLTLRRAVGQQVSFNCPAA